MLHLVLERYGSFGFSSSSWSMLRFGVLARLHWLIQISNETFYSNKKIKSEKEKFQVWYLGVKFHQRLDTVCGFLHNQRFISLISLTYCL